MDFISWSDSLSVGVEAFNKEHQQLIQLINKLNQAIAIKSTQKTMEEILGSLLRYTAIHFKHEEEYFMLYEYPNIHAHKAEHDNLTAQVTDYAERLKNGKAAFSLELLTFLRDWLTNHILGTDMKYKDFFLEKGI